MNKTELEDELKLYNSVRPLKITYKEIADEKYLMCGTLIQPTGDFAVKMSEENPNEVIVPFIPYLKYENAGRFSYFDEIKNKYHTHKTHAQMVRCDESQVYVKLNLVKIVREFGVFVLGRDEKWTRAEVIFKQEIYLRFLRREEKYGWHIVADGSEPAEDKDGVKERIKDWIKEQAKIDGLQRSQAVLDANKAFEKWSEIPTKLIDGKPFAATLQKRKELIDVVEDYFDYQFKFGELTGTHYAYITQQIVICRQTQNVAAAFLKSHSNVINFVKDRYQLFVVEQRELKECQDIFDTLESDLKRLITQRGYWIDKENKKVYPNCGEYQALNRPADENRTSETKEQLRKALLSLEQNADNFIFNDYQPLLTAIGNLNKK